MKAYYRDAVAERERYVAVQKYKGLGGSVGRNGVLDRETGKIAPFGGSRNNAELRAKEMNTIGDLGYGWITPLEVPDL